MSSCSDAVGLLSARDAAFQRMARRAQARTSVFKTIDAPVALTFIFEQTEFRDAAVPVVGDPATRVLENMDWVLYNDPAIFIPVFFGEEIFFQQNPCIDDAFNPPLDLAELAGLVGPVVELARLLGLPDTIRVMSEEVRYCSSGSHEVMHLDNPPLWRTAYGMAVADVEGSVPKKFVYYEVYDAPCLVYAGRLLCSVPLGGLTGGAIRVFGTDVDFQIAERHEKGSTRYAGGTPVSDPSNTTNEYIFLPRGTVHGIDAIETGGRYLFTAQIYCPPKDYDAWMMAREAASR